MEFMGGIRKKLTTAAKKSNVAMRIKDTLFDTYFIYVHIYFITLASNGDSDWPTLEVISVGNKAVNVPPPLRMASMHVYRPRHCRQVVSSELQLLLQNWVVLQTENAPL